MAWAKATETLTVKAGDTIEIAHQRLEPVEWREEMWNNCPDGYGSCTWEGGIHRRMVRLCVINPWHYRTVTYSKKDFIHSGPLVIHLSKVPDGQDIGTYDGSGEWVKIYTLGLYDTGTRFNFPIGQDEYPPRVS